MKRVLVIALVLALAVSAFAWKVKTAHVSKSFSVTRVTADSMYARDTTYVYGPGEYKRFTAQVKIGAGVADSLGSTFGASDIGYVIWKTKIAGLWTTVDSQRFTAIPCSAYVAKVSSDTLFLKDALILIAGVVDSSDATEDTATITYPITYQYILGE